MNTITFASHVAYLDPMTGEGLLVRPKPADDLSLSMISLHAADWDAAIAHLRGLGWEPTADDDGSPMLAGITADGRDIIGLYGREPVTSMPTLSEAAEATGGTGEAGWPDALICTEGAASVEGVAPLLCLSTE